MSDHVLKVADYVYDLLEDRNLTDDEITSLKTEIDRLKTFNDGLEALIMMLDN